MKIIVREDYLLRLPINRAKESRNEIRLVAALEPNDT